MNRYLIFILKSLNKIFVFVFKKKKKSILRCIQNPEIASNKIYELLNSDFPCMIARFGSTELICLKNFIGVNYHRNNYISFIKGESPAWWWEKKIIQQMQDWSGFFPANEVKMEEFGELMIRDIPYVDILGSWLNDEKWVENELISAQKLHLRLLEPFWSQSPWTKALKGKKVLVVHPFAETILYQYSKRENLFINSEILPDFEDLKVIKAVQTLGEGDNRFSDWFEALDFMKTQIDQIDYDVCLIGCGAYGFHLAAHVKRAGKKAVHLGGALQLLFGIKGKRWEDPNYGVKEWGISANSYVNLMNENWLRPNENEKPKHADSVEGACYW
jgi:hypothetical protein